MKLLFSSSRLKGLVRIHTHLSRNMAQIISGKEVAAEIQQRLKEKVSRLNLTPKLAIVQVGDREDSNVYIRMKVKFSQEIGGLAEHFKLPRSTTEQELLDCIDKLNNDPNTHGIIVQLPLDSEHNISQDLVTNAVSPLKDVDGLSDLNAGKLFHGQVQETSSCFLPCTPFGCLEMIRKSGMTVSGKNAVVVGRSKIVGNPMAQLLLWHDATVTVTHRKSKDVHLITRQADILVVACGVPEMVKRDWVKPGAVVIDCGITAIDDPSKKSGKRLVGDVDFNAVKEVAMAITPVPGGVGPMTVAMLINNTVLAAERMSKQK